MKKKSKRNLGLKCSSDFSKRERAEIVKDYLLSNESKSDIWRKYTGQQTEKGQLIRWMRALGYDTSLSTRSAIFHSGNMQMAKKKTINKQGSSYKEEMLNNRILELEKQLKDAELKAIAYSNMVDIAEKEFNISIRKKSNTKPSEK